LFLFGISSSQVLPNKSHDGRMNLTDNCARFFVVVTFLTFGEACLKYLEKQKSWESHDELKKKEQALIALDIPIL